MLTLSRIDKDAYSFFPWEIAIYGEAHFLIRSELLESPVQVLSAPRYNLSHGHHLVRIRSTGSPRYLKRGMISYVY